MRLRRGLIDRNQKKGERGASLVEYALLVALIAVVCIAAVTFLGSSASTKFNKAGDGIGSVPMVGGVCPSGYNINLAAGNCVPQH